MAKMPVTRSFNANLDASFSTHLNLKPNDSSTTTTLHAHAHQNACALDDCEISIFDAQNYFNQGGGSNNNNNNATTTPPHHHAQINLDTKRVPLTRVSLGALPRISSASSVDTPSRNNYRVGVGGRSFRATPTASSEASWNSQTGLLSNPPGSIKVSLRNVPTSTTPPYVHQKKTKPSSRSNWFFGRRCPCPCTGQKSLQVDEKPIQPITPVRSVIVEKPIMLKTVESVPVVVKQETVKAASCRALMHQELTISRPKLGAENTQRIVATGRTFRENATVAGFSFPILNNNPVKLIVNPVSVTPPPMIDSPPNLEEAPRESLEVSLDEETWSRNLWLDLAVDREGCSLMFPASPKARMRRVRDEDGASDGSSELFEIESLCMTEGGMGGLYYDPMRGTECYEPSEGSIDWSVTTAEGIERGIANGGG